MTTQFDKIYVISLTLNKSRQEFVKKQMNELGLDFEFIYGVDFYNIKYNFDNNPITWPLLFNGDGFNGGTFGCAVSHYSAVFQAYEFGYNNVLILEDDICFIKDKKLIEEYLNNIPNDADFITYDPRFYNKEYYYELLKVMIKDKNKKWILLENSNNGLIGGMMYGLMNRETMKLYLNAQHNNFTAADSIHGIFRYPNDNIKRYVANKCIITDHYNIKNNLNFNEISEFYVNIYKNIDKTLSKDSFNIPNDYSIFTRYN